MCKINTYKHLNFEELFEEVKALPDVQSKMPLWDDFLIDVMDELCELSPEKYLHYYMRFYILNYGYHFNEDMFEYATSMMKNVDGSTGKRWNADEVEVIAKQKGILPNTHYGLFDVAYVANMYASDSCNPSLTEQENIDNIFWFTKGFLQDPDGADGRAMRFFKKVAMWKPDKN